MKEILVNSLKLCIITLVAGVLLGLVYEVTKEPRAKQEEKAKQEAYKNVLEEADSFNEIDYDKDAMAKFISDGGYSKSVAIVDEVVSACDSTGNILGYVITVTDKEGYGGDIKFTIGIMKDGTINGISFLSIEETAGVGMKATESKFMKQFKGKKVDSIEYTKTGAVADNQIDAISGATVTTNAVTNGVNAGILAYKYISQEGDGANE